METETASVEIAHAQYSQRKYSRRVYLFSSNLLQSTDTMKTRFNTVDIRAVIAEINAT